MTEKLVKTGNDYILYSKDNSVLGITSGTMEGRMLSLKNCQAIERGYDLDELADEHCNKLYHEGNINWDRYRVHFKLGFQKALEILGDKKFSEEDISKAIDFGVHVEAGNIDIDYKRYDTKENQFIQSLQQTEFDVEILMGTNYRDIDCVNEGNLVASKIVKDNEAPMLDKEGCLILKRI